MAFQTGSQVNPALGRTDFTPFLQGAMQGAQAQARGAELIGQGLAGLGQQVASGMREQYKEAKEFKLEERKYRDTIASGMKILDVLSKTPDIPESVKKLLPQLTQGFGNPNVPLSEQAASATTLGNIFGAVLSSGLKTTMENAADNAAAQYANAVTAAGGRPFPMVTPVSATAQARGEEMAAKLANLKADTAQKLTPKTPNLSFQEQQLAASVQDFVGKNNRLPTPAENVKLMQDVQSSGLPPRQYPTPAEVLSAESGKQAIISGSEYVKVAKQNYADSSAQFETASTINNALKNPKITTGFLAKASGTFRNLAESLFGGDFKAAESEIYQKGVSGFGLAGVRALFRGLGAMSDGDRQRGESTQMSITDPKKSIEYYTEVAKLNQERAREDVNTINKLQRQGVNADEIQRQIEELKMNRSSISDQAYGTVFGQPNPSATDEADKALIKKYSP